MPPVAVSASPSRSLARVPGARKAAFPGFIVPCDPTLRDQPPRHGGWLYEIKADGYRAQLHLDRASVKVYSRTGLDWTGQFPAFADAAPALAAKSAIIDGEAVVYGKNGLPDFQQLRRELGSRNSDRLVHHAFDLLYLDGYDLRDVAYVERKRLLQKLLAGASPRFVYVEHLAGEGAKIFRQACKLRLEGVVAKRADAPYRSGRQESWIKLKCTRSDTFPIVAFIEKLGARPRKIASLYIGRRENGRLLYAGKVRSGYAEKTGRELRELLNPLIIDRSPLDVPVHKPKATWVRPEVEAEIAFGGVTNDGLLRAAVFKGLRDDVELPQVKSPPLAPGRARAPRIGVPRENILQLLPDAVVPSKEQLAAYWRKAGKRALPYLARRPLKLVRHVNGTTFYHMGPLPADIPAAVHRLRINKREGGEGTRLWVDSVDGLLGLVEIGAVELHPWNATVDDIEHADTLVFDLDPGEGVAWEFVTQTALRLRELLITERLDPWPKLTGGKGLHVMVPVAPAPAMTHDEAHRYCRALAQRLARDAPERFTLSAAMKERRGRLFIDYLRNGRGTTAIGAYSPRARENFPIAAPVTWKQVERGTPPDAFTITRLPRLSRRPR